MRKLASIQTINAIEPIVNADAIERARVLGWWIVVKKGEYAVGDKVVYCEIDSLLPERAEFEFLRASSFKPAIDQGDAFTRPAGFRIKTIKLRGQVSQGICFPLSLLPEGTAIVEGDDVTAALAITKYDVPLPANMGDRIRGPFPGFIPKTDETRVQVLETVLARHRGKVFTMTEKLDGTSYTAFLRDGEFGVCSRNLQIEHLDETNVLAQVAVRLDLEAKLRLIQEKYGFQPAIQGELIGLGIQKNKYAIKGCELRVFNLFNSSESRFLDAEQCEMILKELGLHGVPHLGTIELNHSIDELVQMSMGTSVLNKNTQREGIVLRPLVEEYDDDLAGRLSFKVINPQFLLKYDE